MFNRHFWLKFYLLPAFIFIMLSFLSHELKFDLWLTRNFIYDGGFSLRNDFFFEVIMHKYAAKGVIVFNVLTLVAIFFAKDQKNKKKLIYILTATLLSMAVVSLMKTITVIACPWSLAEFGGTASYVHFWEMISSRYPDSSCFPAGHSSGGFALMSFFYSILLFNKKSAYIYLLPALFVGVAFGVVQQFRGAHFLSHDLMTIAVCILVNFICSFLVIKIGFLDEKN